MSTDPRVKPELVGRKSRPQPPGTPPLKGNEISELIGSLHGWTVDQGVLRKQFAFANYHETIAFVNAVAWVSHREDHHPDLEVGYNKCTVRYSTHSVGGLSENDFICAAKLEALMTL
jgi:4a-hydroxytetrahydrobiopterin dehydratase